MKTYLFSLVSFLFLFPLIAWGASFERDLFFGVSSDPDVTRLQEFLRNQGFYRGPITGGFFALTKDAVKKFQEAKGILPAAGYFGRKTRAVANVGVSVEVLTPQGVLAAQLQEQIRALQMRLQELQEQQKRESTLPSASLVSPAPSPSPQPLATPAVSASVATATPQATGTPSVSRTGKIEVEGTREMKFPDPAASQLKLGDITIRNGLVDDVLLSQIVMRVTDQMNAPINRNREVFLMLRKGTTTMDELVSKTTLRFSSLAPPQDDPHRYEVKMSFPFLLASGKEVTAGLWIEELDYVISGMLKFELAALLASTSLTPSGTFTFTLTK